MPVDSIPIEREGLRLEIIFSNLLKPEEFILKSLSLRIKEPFLIATEKESLETSMPQK
jgi:hypothetical protein